MTWNWKMYANSAYKRYRIFRLTGRDDILEIRYIVKSKKYDAAWYGPDASGQNNPPWREFRIPTKRFDLAMKYAMWLIEPHKYYQDIRFIYI